MTDRPDWRDRLRIALDRSNKKHSYLARQAGIAPATLSRILNGHHRNVSIETICRLADTAEVTVGWLLNEPFRGVELSDLESVPQESRCYPAADCASEAVTVKRDGRMANMGTSEVECHVLGCTCRAVFRWGAADRRCAKCGHAEADHPVECTAPGCTQVAVGTGGPAPSGLPAACDEHWDRRP